MKILDSNQVERAHHLAVGVAGPSGATSLHILEGSISRDKISFTEPTFHKKGESAEQKETFGLLLGLKLSRAQFISAIGSVYHESQSPVPFADATGLYQ